jgi:transposase
MRFGLDLFKQLTGGIKMSTWIGIDVSMETFDFSWVQNGETFHGKEPNSDTGFQRLVDKVPGEACFIMEATGPYSFNLALFLSQAKRHVAVVNPISTKSHLRSELSRTKSDKTDALSLARYGKEKEPATWLPHDREISEMRQMLGLDAKLTHLAGQLKNMNHAYGKIKHYSPHAILRIRRLLELLQREQAENMKELEGMAEKVMPREVEILETIPGIGKASAIRVAVSVGDFRLFETSRKLNCYVGLSPTTKQSGKSIRSRGQISRMGGASIRRQLFMCALSAKQYNPQCKAMWERMKESNKHSKVALVAIMSKLIRQMHSMVVNDQVYNPCFR